MKPKLAKPNISMGWILLIAINLVPLVMWLGMMPLSSRFMNTYASLTNISRLAGLTAVLLFSLNLILSVRLRWFEDLFGGLNKVYIAHHIIGGVSICLVLLHSLALSIRLAGTSMRDAALMFLPSSKDWPTTFGILSLWLFALLMFLTFYVKLPYRWWLLSHKFLGLAFTGIALHVILISSDTSVNPWLKWYLLIFVALGAVAFIYHTLLGKFLIRRYSYGVVNVTHPAKGVTRFFLLPKGTPMNYQPGQFVFANFQIDGALNQWHPFSISSHPNDKYTTITVKDLGDYTDEVNELAPQLKGAEVLLEGSYGRFMFKKMPHKRQIWIAGGIGVTPFLGMLAEIDQEYMIDLYYTVRDADEIIDWQAIREIAISKQGHLRLVPFVSSKDGRLTASKVQEISGDLSQSEILICGPPEMMHSLKEQFTKRGISRKQIHTEEFALQ